MRKVFLALISILFTGTVLAEGIFPGHSGAWYNSEQPGHGLSVEVISPERAIVFWYAFDPQGNPIWLYIDGSIEGNVVQGDAYYLDGMVWGLFDPSTKNMQSWGTVNLEFNDCNSAEVVWNSEFAEYGQGQLPLVRLTSIHGLACNPSTLSIFGYYDVVWTETDTEEKHYGKAIIDTTGFMTTLFVEPQFGAMRMFGQVSTTPDEHDVGGQVDMDVQLFKTPLDPIEELDLSGGYSYRSWPYIWVESDADSFEFTMNGERQGDGAITQETLVGEWQLEFAGETYEVQIGPDGKFEWTVYAIGLAAVFNYQMTLTVPQNGVPVLLASLHEHFFRLALAGHAIYYRSQATGKDSIEIRVMDSVFNFGVTLVRED